MSTTTAATPRKRGWAAVPGAKKWHYFDDDFRSLCGRWGLLGTPEYSDTNHDSPDNCAACQKARANLAQDGER